MDRNIRLKTVHNMRTLEGLEGHDGMHIGKNLLFRSAILDKVSDREEKLLKDAYDISSVIDLRTIDEKEKHPEKILKGISYKYIPVSEVELPGVSREAEPGSPDVTADMLPYLSELYRNIINDESCMRNFNEILTEIITNRDGGIMWHCTAGKDRAGLVTMLVLSMLGVSWKDILDDYMLSDKDSKKTARKYALLITLFKRDRDLAKKVYESYTTDEIYLLSAFDAAERMHGSMDGYIVDGIGIDRNDILRFNEYILR